MSNKLSAESLRPESLDPYGRTRERDSFSWIRGAESEVQSMKGFYCLLLVCAARFTGSAFRNFRFACICIPPLQEFFRWREPE